jgi:penicillin-binding protein A
MGRRIRWLGVIMVLCLGLVIVQLVNIQLVQEHKLADSPNNPGNSTMNLDNARGEILASDGTVLAQSVRAPAGSSADGYPYDYVREYPQKSLYSDITGYDSILDFGKTDIEAQYNAYLSLHRESPQTLSQLIFREKLPTTTDSVTLTVEPKLQQAAEEALASISFKNKDGAIVVLNPKTGAVLAMYSSPAYDPNTLVGTSLAGEKLAYVSYTTADSEGFFPLRPLATGDSFFPGSTMKVITSTAVYNLDPSLIGFDYPSAPCQKFSDSDKSLCNDGDSPATATACGGTMVQMLPASCDPGYAELGVKLGVANLREQAELFGINAQPPIDLPSNSEQPVGGVIESTLETLPDTAQALQGYSAIGQDTVAETALQNAMVAEGIADGGTVMTPHLMSSITSSQGNVVKTYEPSVYKQAAPASAAQSVTSLMESVVTSGTATITNFPAYLCAAVKTGTAQTGLGLNHDWMIGFAPANNPQVAIAVVVPWQPIESEGATVAGPIMKAMMEAALPEGSVSQPCTVQAPSGSKQ